MKKIANKRKEMIRATTVPSELFQNNNNHYNNIAVFT